MALGDWVTHESAARMSTSLDISTPLVGNGSLKLQLAAASALYGYNMHLSSDFDRGFTKGRIRTIVRMDDRPSALEFNSRMGIICMQSAFDLSTTGSCYVFSWGNTNQATTTYGFCLQKYTAGLDVAETSGGGPYLVSPSEVAASNGDYYPIQLEWVADVTNLGGTRLTASRGTLNSLDFTTLATIFDLIDTSSPLTTSVAEGLCAKVGTTNSVAIQFSFDETTVYQLT